MDKARKDGPDLIILDLMLPKLDGLTICQKLREKQNHTPILMLTAKNTVEDVSTGLNSGADDYLVKPFSFIELKSRILALIRRSHHDSSPILKTADLEIDRIFDQIRECYVLLGTWGEF